MHGRCRESAAQLRVEDLFRVLDLRVQKKETAGTSDLPVRLVAAVAKRIQRFVKSRRESFEARRRISAELGDSFVTFGPL